MDYLDRLPDYSDDDLSSATGTGEHLVAMRLHEASEFNLYRLIIQTNRNAYSIDFDRRGRVEKIVENLKQLIEQIEFKK